MIFIFPLQLLLFLSIECLLSLASQPYFCYSFFSLYFLSFFLFTFLFFCFITFYICLFFLFCLFLFFFYIFSSFFLFIISTPNQPTYRRLLVEVMMKRKKEEKI